MLTANTLYPGNHIAGNLFFTKDKSAQPLGLTVIIGEDTFYFGG